MSRDRDIDAAGGPTPDTEAAAWFAVLREAAADSPAWRAFRAWHDSAPAHVAAWRRLRSLWHSPALAGAPRRLPRRGQSGRKLAAAAAVLLLAAAAVWLVSDPLRPRADYAAATGERRGVSLADGTMLLLGPERR